MIVAVADTHAAIWYLADDVRISDAAGRFMDNAADNADKIAVSAITLVEMVYLVERQRISAHEFSRLAAALQDQDSVFTEVPVSLRTARALTRVDVTQIPDMPDRIIAATALELGVPLVSRDRRIVLSSIRTIW